MRRSCPVIVVIHGPNLNLLGTREPHIYGSTTLREIDDDLKAVGAELGVSVETFQSNHEGLLIDRVQQAHGKAAGLIVNAGGLTHTSVSLRDAIAAIKVPTVEVHLSNLYTRERNSATTPIWPRSVWGRLQGWARSVTVWRSTHWPTGAGQAAPSLAAAETI
jgi:3-dehydroquinate dehydratase-2